jgi:hypothetical protein
LILGPAILSAGDEIKGIDFVPAGDRLDEPRGLLTRTGGEDFKWAS